MIVATNAAAIVVRMILSAKDEIAGRVRGGTLMVNKASKNVSTPHAIDVLIMPPVGMS